MYTRQSSTEIPSQIVYANSDWTLAWALASVFAQHYLCMYVCMYSLIKYHWPLTMHARCKAPTWQMISLCFNWGTFCPIHNYILCSIAVWVRWTVVFWWVGFTDNFQKQLFNKSLLYCLFTLFQTRLLEDLHCKLNQWRKKCFRQAMTSFEAWYLKHLHSSMAVPSLMTADWYCIIKEANMCTGHTNVFRCSEGLSRLDSVRNADIRRSYKKKAF